MVKNSIWVRIRRYPTFIFVLGAIPLGSTSVEAGRCKQLLHNLGIKRLFYVRNPLPEMGNQKLFASIPAPTPGVDELIQNAKALQESGKLDPGQVRQVARVLLSPASVYNDALERLKSYVRKMYWWGFIDKKDRDEILIRAEQSASLREKNPFHHDHAQEVYKKPYTEVTLDDAVELLDPNWNSYEKMILRAPEIEVVRPSLRAGRWIAAKAGGIIVLAVFFSIAYGVLESTNAGVKEMHVGEARRMSFVARYAMEYGNGKELNHVDDKDRDWLRKMYVQKNAGLTDFEAESRWEYIGVYTTLSMAEKNLYFARDQLKSEDLLGVHLRFIYELLNVYPELKGNPQGEDIRKYAESLIQIFDPTGKFKPSGDAKH